MDQRTEAFEQHRTRLSGLAYRMLGSRADAEDIVQDAYLRWHRAASDEIRSPEAWLVTIVMRLCIDRLRQARAERDAYVGPWLPEPLVMSGDKEALLSVLAKDATWTSDGGGKAKAAQKTIRGADRVARFVLGVLGHPDRIQFRDIIVNGESGLATYSRGQLIAVLSIKTDGMRILDAFSVLNPDKLQKVSQSDSFIRLVGEGTENRKDLS